MPNDPPGIRISRGTSFAIGFDEAGVVDLDTPHCVLDNQAPPHRMHLRGVVKNGGTTLNHASPLVSGVERYVLTIDLSRPCHHVPELTQALGRVSGSVSTGDQKLNGSED